MNYLLITLLFFSSNYSKAQSDQDNAKAIASHRLKMKPKTEFEKWYADQWTQAAVNCFVSFQMPIPREIEKLPLFNNGTFSLPKDEKSFCRAMAIKKAGPQCFSIKSASSPFIFPPAGLPSDYIYMNRMIPDKTIVDVGGECNLIENEFSTKQFFAGKGKVVWLVKPSIQSVNTFKGAVSLNMGTLAFEIEGMSEKTMPVSAVILNQ